MTDAFAAPSPAADTTESRGPGWSAWLRFIARRMLVLGALPLLTGFTTLGNDLGALGINPLLVAAAVSLGVAALWVPTTITMLRVRFFAAHDDDRPVLLTSGEWMDRASYLSFVRALCGERVAAGLTLLVMAVAIIGFTPIAAAVLLAMTLPYLGWSVIYNRYAIAHATAFVDLVGGDAERAWQRLEPLFSHPRVNYFLLDAALLLRARVHLRLGRPDDALADLDAVRRAKRLAAPLRAEILVGRGETAPAKKLIASMDATALVARLQRARLQYLLDLHSDHPERIEPDPELLAAMPPQVRGSLELLIAAGQWLAGKQTEARATLAACTLSPSDHTWIEAVWPRWWGALSQIEARPPDEVPSR